MKDTVTGSSAFMIEGGINGGLKIMDVGAMLAIAGVVFMTGIVYSTVGLGAASGVIMKELLLDVFGKISILLTTAGLTLMLAGAAAMSGNESLCNILASTAIGILVAAVALLISTLERFQLSAIVVTSFLGSLLAEATSITGECSQ